MRKENLESLADDSSPDNSRLDYYTRQRKEEKKKSRMRLNEALEKFSSDPTDANLSQAESANLRDARWVLQMWKENLDLADPAAEHFDMGMKLSEALEKFSSDLTDSHLSQEERAKQEVSRKILSSWYENLKEYADKRSEDQRKKCRSREKLYNDWKEGKISIFSKVKHLNLFWKDLF
jgi:vacuolar-type H+-ATPase subunit E/Vma4